MPRRRSAPDVAPCAHGRGRRGDATEVVAGHGDEHVVGRLDALAARRPPEEGERQVGAAHELDRRRSRRSSTASNTCSVRRMPARTSSPAGVRPGPRPPSSGPRRRGRRIEAGRPAITSRPARQGRAFGARQRSSPGRPRTGGWRPRRHGPEVDRRGPMCSRPSASTTGPSVVAGGKRVDAEVQRTCGAVRGRRSTSNRSRPRSTWTARVNTARTRPQPRPATRPGGPGVEADHPSARSRAITALDEARDRRGGDAGADLPRAGRRVQDARRDLRRDPELDDPAGVDAERRPPAVEHRHA